MRAAAVIFLALAVAACGSSTDSGDPSDVPQLEITSLRTNGLIATIEISATDGGDLLDVEIDWGDESVGTELRGEGRLSADHAYVPGTDEVTVTVEATDADGNVVSSGRSLDLPDSVDGTAVPGTDTTTVASTSTAPTTVAPTTTAAPTTTSPPTTTAPPTSVAPPPPTTSTTTTTTTTTVPEPVEIVIPLTLSVASVDTDVSDGRAGVLDAAVGTFGVETATIGISETDFSEITLTWTVDPGAFAAAGPDPRLQVLLDTRLSGELTTGDWAGMRALMYMESVGTYGGVEFGRSEQVIAQVDRDGEAVLRDEPFSFGFGSPVEGEPAPIRVSLTARCSVAGSTNAFGVLSVARCDAYEAGRILLADARVTVSESTG